ncbi:MAG: dienelactone hydrolase family protein [Frankia sp.]|nr:dienelactone hydrolase family protein [Frankia sp.]
MAIDIHPLRVPGRDVELNADLDVPDGARGLVIFAHGSGSSRFSPRNRAVAGTLLDAGFGTLLADLLTADEEAEDMTTGRYRFDIELLAGRVVDLIDWATSPGGPSGRRLALPRSGGIGLFGASTGAAAALIAAARRPDTVGAVVSRGGRPDLAGADLPRVTAPTLLIVGGADDVVITLNQEALARLCCPARLVVVPGATHLFEEPGAMETVADLAARHFGEHLTATVAP